MEHNQEDTVACPVCDERMKFLTVRKCDPYEGGWNNRALSDGALIFGSRTLHPVEQQQPLGLNLRNDHRGTSFSIGALTGGSSFGGG